MSTTGRITTSRFAATGAAAVLAGGGLLPAMPADARTVATAAPAAATATTPPLLKVTLAGTAPAGKKTFQFSGATTQTPGELRVSLTVPSGEGSILLFRLKPGYTESDVFGKPATATKSATASSSAREPAAAMKSVPSARAAHARQLARATKGGVDAETQAQIDALKEADKQLLMVGGISAKKGRSSTMTVRVTAGTYYLADLDSDKDYAKTFVVKGTARAGTTKSAGTVTAIDGHRFSGDATLPAKGTAKFANAATDGWHYPMLQQLRKDATRTMVTRYLNFGEVPKGDPLFGSATLSIGMLSKSRTELVTYALPAGTYMVADFWPDLEDGTPHIYRGMYKILKLK